MRRPALQRNSLPNFGLASGSRNESDARFQRSGKPAIMRTASGDSSYGDAAMTEETPVWFITGCSSGLGRALAEACVAHDFRVVATARDAGKLTDLAKGAEDRVLSLALDITDHAQI